MTKLKISSSELVANARARIEEVETKDLIAQLDDPEVVIVDIRDIRERQRGFIPGSIHAPRGMLEFWIDPESPYHRDVFAQEGKKYVLHCAAGWRSALSAEQLNDLGWACAHLKEGFATWEEHGGPVEMPEKKD